MHRARRQDRAAHRHDAVHQVGPAGGQSPREHAAQAVPDDADLATASDGDRLEPTLEAVRSLAGASHVDVDLGAVGAVARSSEHRRHPGERGVPAMKPGTSSTGSRPVGRPAPAYDDLPCALRSSRERRTNRAASSAALPSRERARRPRGPTKPSGRRKSPIGEFTLSKVADFRAYRGYRPFPAPARSDAIVRVVLLDSIRRPSDQLRGSRCRASSRRTSKAAEPATRTEVVRPRSCSRRSAPASSCATRPSATPTPSRCCW